MIELFKKEKNLKKKYYKITASMYMKRTVLVPIEAVEDLDAAIDADESRCRLVSAWQIYRYNDTISSKLRQRRK